jgi:hypothetical protein
VIGPANPGVLNSFDGEVCSDRDKYSGPSRCAQRQTGAVRLFMPSPYQCVSFLAISDCTFRDVVLHANLIVVVYRGARLGGRARRAWEIDRHDRDHNLGYTSALTPAPFCLHFDIALFPRPLHDNLTVQHDDLMYHLRHYAGPWRFKDELSKCEKLNLSSGSIDTRATRTPTKTRVRAQRPGTMLYSRVHLVSSSLN